MFYANNEQVKGIFLNGRNYNYLAYGFGKIIPEDRTAEQLNLNLARKYLNKYIIEFGTVKDGYDNALVSPRFDNPENGIFHTPFTYYYNGNIISTKEVPVLITDGNYALRNALVYNDMNINGAINYFATNTDFQGHKVNVLKEAESFQVYQALLNYEMLNNCSNFDLNINTRFSKAAYPTLNNCNNFSGNFKYVGNQDYNYPGFRGFLYECKDGAFNIDCTNMHGGGSDANVTNYYNFSGIQSCENMNINITGSPWQAWPHDHSRSCNCNITTRYIVPGFDRINHCNLNIYLPPNANVEKSAFYSLLSNSYNCNVYFDGTNSNLYSFRNNNFSLFLFEDLNNCNLNLALNNSTGIDFSFGNRLNNCNIQFNHMNIAEQIYLCWGYMNNCNITGNVINAEYSAIDLVAHSTNVNLNINASLTNNFSLLWNTSSINGNVILGNVAYVRHSNNLILYLYNGNYFISDNVGDSKFTLNNVKDVNINGTYNTNFNLHNATGNAVLRNLNNVDFVERGSANYTITNLDNCYNSFIYVNALSGTIENVYDSFLVFTGGSGRSFGTWRVNNCSITGFPNSFSYTANCRFDVGLEEALAMNSSYVTWNNVWPHGFIMSSGSYRYLAGLRSVDGFISRCSMGSDDMVLDGSITFNNVNNMQTSIVTYYKGTVTANLPIYNMNIKLNVDCNTLNLGVFQAGPPHGFQNATISANDIYAKGNMPSAYVQVNCDTKIYCENYCNIRFRPHVTDYNSVLQPVILINNYDHANSGNQYIYGGLTRIGSLSARTGPRSLTLYSGACVFINNAVLNGAIVDNSLLFLGSNITWANGASVTNGGRIVTLSNWDSSALSFVERKSLAWNIWDSGPWGSQSLLNFCLNV